MLRFSGFPPCDGVGGTLKRLTPRASLQTLEQILTPKQLFEFENGEITGIKTYFVNSQSVKQNVAFLESRISNCSLFKGTRKNHEFIPGGGSTGISCLSGGDSENLLIQHKEVVLSTDHIMPGSLYACS